MAKGIYIGVNNVARKAKPYIGVGGVAKKVKKGYIGVNGLPRLMFSADLEYKSTTSLSSTRSGHAGASIGGNAIFASGSLNGTGDSQVATVEAYNSNLVRTMLSDVSAAKYMHLACSNSNYAIFAGGVRAYSGNSYDVDAYNSSLVRTAAYLTNTAAVDGMQSCASVGNYAIFGANGYSSGACDAFDQNLTKSYPSLSYAKGEVAGANTRNHALFAGGAGTPEAPSSVDAFDSNLVRTALTSLAYPRRRMDSASMGDCAVFGGGYNINMNASAVVEAYDRNLVRYTLPSLSASGNYRSKISCEGYAIFTGYGTNVMDVYDSSFVKQNTVTLSANKSSVKAATAGNILLIAAGSSSGYPSSSIDVYEF